MKTSRPNPSLMSLRDLEEAIDVEMAAHPNGCPYADLLIDEFERRDCPAPGAAKMLSHAELDEAIAAEMKLHPMGSDRATELHDEFERRQGAHILVESHYPGE